MLLASIARDLYLVTTCHTLVKGLRSVVLYMQGRQ